MADYAATLIALMDALGWKEELTFRVSFGGMIAQHVAALRHPDVSPGSSWLHPSVEVARRIRWIRSTDSRRWRLRGSWRATTAQRPSRDPRSSPRSSSGCYERRWAGTDQRRGSDHEMGEAAVEARGRHEPGFGSVRLQRRRGGRRPLRSAGAPQNSRDLAGPIPGAH